jgi:hypothetical protein
MKQCGRDVDKAEETFALTPQSPNYSSPRSSEESIKGTTYLVLG